MSLAQMADVHFAYPGNEILEGASLMVRPGDRLALVGPNGTGKSTVLRLMAGDLQADSGDVRVLGKATVAYLRQSQEFGGTGTVMDALLEPFADVLRLHDELRDIEHRMAEADEATLKRYGELQERYMRAGGYEIESRVRRLTADVGFTTADLERTVESLSGGERGRLELTKTLVRQPDLLLLDEPTNHLDLDATERIEGYLRDYPGAFVLVSHDRAFIRATCREVVELDDGRLVRYAFGWDKYVVERAGRLERARAEYERQKEHVEKTEDFIRRNLAGQKTKQAQSRRRMLEKLERLERPDDNWELAGHIGLTFSAGPDLGPKEPLRAVGVTAGYSGGQDPPSARTVVRGVTLSIYRGEKVGIVGPNGAGKSTLLKTLIGVQAPLEGQTEIGPGVRIGYFDQKLQDMNAERTLVDEVRSVRADLSTDAVRSYLAKFRFFGDDPFRTVGGLSGGERSRLAMAKIMMFPRNLLALDEPTNHLDIPARETLEEALREYEGTVVVISHDRYFLDRVCGRLLIIAGSGPGGGEVESYPGNYSEWREHLGRAAAATAPAPAPAQEAPTSRAPSGAEQTRAAAKERERERRRLERRVETLEGDVAKLEEQLAALRAELAADHGGNWQKLHELADRERELDGLLQRRMEEWERAGAELQSFLAG